MAREILDQKGRTITIPTDRPDPDSHSVIHVVLDTSALGKDHHLRGADFSALERLCVSRSIKLHIPAVVEAEVKAHIEDEYVKAAKALKTPLHELRRLKLPFVQESTLNSLASMLKKMKKEYPKRAIARLDKKLLAMDCEIVEIDLTQAKKTMENYFKGDPPFGKPRNRNDLPDGFIFQSIASVSRNHGAISVIVNDKRLSEACDEIPLTKTYSSLKDFFASPTCRPLLLEEEAKSNVNKILGLLDSADLQEPDWEAWVLDNLPDSFITDHRLPSDDDEGLVMYVDDPTVNLDFSATNYLGKGVFSIPVSLEVMAGINYAIFKADWYILSDERKAGMSISDLNDHFWGVEEEFDLIVEGVVVMELDFNELRKPTLSDEELKTLLEATELEMEPDYEISLFDAAE